MLNNYNNMGSLKTSDQQIKNILEMIHQVNIRIPSVLFTCGAFRDIIIDEDCLLGNPWGHKYIHSSGECIKKGIYHVYYSKKHDYYVIESRVVIPINILRKIKKGLNIVDRTTLVEIGKEYVRDLERAFHAIGEHKLKTTGVNGLRQFTCANGQSMAEVSNAATAIIGNRPELIGRKMTGMHKESKLRAPMTMMLIALYNTMNGLCDMHDVATTKLIDPVYYYRKDDVDMTFVLSYINEIDWYNEGFETVHHIHYCWDAIERNLLTTKVFMEGEEPDDYFIDTHYPELNDDRIADLYNLLLHLYFHEMGHVKYGLDCDESQADEWAKNMRSFAKSRVDFVCEEWSHVTRRIFNNYSNYFDECTIYN